MSKTLSLFFIVTGFLLPMFPYDAAAQHREEETDFFVHPFLAHMGVPDNPGEGSLRGTGIQARLNGVTSQDAAVHIEAGLAGRLGLHLRTEGIKKENFSEVMLQYAVIADKTLDNGFCVFGQLGVPTGPVAGNEYRGLFGVSARLTAGSLVIWDANIHYDPVEKAAEFENAFVFRMTSTFYPILEVRGHVNEDTETYMLPAIKFKTGKHSAFGAGYQIPLSEHKAYDSQALFTYDTGF